ncbi:MAG: hypothetical protein ACLTH0_09245 [Blautia producta]
MTTEEKLQHFSEVSMETAREEAEKAITEFRSALDADLEQHKKEKQAASKQQLKAEAENAAREINKALSAEHLHIRKLSKTAGTREQLFRKSRTANCIYKIRRTSRMAGRPDKKPENCRGGELKSACP